MRLCISCCACADLADTQGVQSLHIRMMPVDHSPRSGYLQPKLDNLLPADWTLFDLRPLRQVLNAPGSVIHPDLAGLVSGYDMVVMVPEATRPRSIR